MAFTARSGPSGSTTGEQRASSRTPSKAASPVRTTPRSTPTRTARSVAATKSVDSSPKIDKNWDQAEPRQRPSNKAFGGAFPGGTKPRPLLSNPNRGAFPSEQKEKEGRKTWVPSNTHRERPTYWGGNRPESLRNPPTSRGRTERLRSGNSIHRPGEETI